MMTKTLQKAIEEASKLPNPEQEELAAWLLEELHSEQPWAQLLEGTDQKLEQLTDEVLTEHQENRTETLDPDTL